MSRQRQRHTPRRYPRVARVNEVVRETLADEIERLSDPRLGIVTITGVDVTADLRHATVWYSALAPGGKLAKPDDEGAAERAAETQAALRSAAPHLQAEIGRQVRMKYVPELTFLPDPSIAEGLRVEQILRDINASDDGRSRRDGLDPEPERAPGERWS